MMLLVHATSAVGAYRVNDGTTESWTCEDIVDHSGGIGEIITEAPFFNLNGQCVPQEFPVGPVPNDCNGNGIPDKYDSQPCEGGEEPNECADNPCAEGCPGSFSSACGDEEEPDEPGGGDGVGVDICTDDDGDDICNECDPDEQRFSLEDGKHYCSDEDENGVCDDCEEADCWARIIEKLWWVVLFRNASGRCDTVVITLDPEFGPLLEPLVPFPIVNFAFDTCWSQHHFTNNFRLAFRGGLTWLVSIYFWWLWLRFFWGL
ncbi:hypothetical protein [Botrimarina mediterranea]|uniref:hypothetical protein n=1 Tax=Botrimarina mediterranea TaxID=2528022 RepID=UPI0011A77A96